MRCWEVVQLVGLQTLDLAILVRVQASQPIFLLAAEGLAVFLQFRFPVPTKNLVGQPPEVIRTACPSPFGTIRRASVLPQKTKVRIANGHTARSAFPHERLQASLRSGSFARVKVMQAANFRNLDHLTERRKLDRSADGRIFFERQMRTASFVVFEIILQNPAQPGLMENNDVIRHSRRMEPSSRSAKGFCHGDRGAARTSRMPIDFAVSQNFSPYTRSRSRSK